jgi:hypothetical protein
VTITTEAVVSKPSSTLVKAEFASGNFKLDKFQVRACLVRGSGGVSAVVVSLGPGLPRHSLSAHPSLSPRRPGRLGQEGHCRGLPC